MNAKTSLLLAVLLGSLVVLRPAPAQDAILMTTITNPAPAYKDYFGYSVAAVGSDRVLIGAYGDETGNANAGTAYLFRTNGTLLTTLTNPAPAYNDQFGWSVASVGGDVLVVGAWLDDAGSGGSDAGAVFLFGTNGTLLTTLTNPTPANYDYFGYSVAALGSDRLVIGAYQDDTGEQDTGVVYLFSTNGVLLTTITNPAPGYYDWFGRSVAAVGGDGVLVGAPWDDAGGKDAGSAFLLSTNGTLLTTFTNPAPASSDYFGQSLAGVGTDRVLIGAYQADKGATNSGVAYLFSTNGTLLTTITNPAPVADDFFGCAVAAMGNDRVLIGAHQKDTRTVLDAGAAYLFSLPPAAGPTLTICCTATNTLSISWPSSSTGWILEENTNGVCSANWCNVTEGIEDNGTAKNFIVTPSTGHRFYRLHRP